MLNSLIKQHKILLLVLLLTIAYTASSYAGDAHIHGQASMNIVLDGEDLMVNATLSAHDIVGFEYQPQSESDKQKVTAAIKTLSDVGKWIYIKSGQCAKHDINIIDPFVHEHIEAGHSHHHDFEVSVYLKCQKPQQLSELQIKLKQFYSQIQKIEIQWLVHNKQGLTHLHENEQKVRFQ